MFTLIAIVLMVRTNRTINEAQQQDASEYSLRLDDKEVGRCTLHIRQDVRLLCLQLANLILLVGVLTDVVLFGDKIKSLF